jgi:hypothetical protein
MIEDIRPGRYRTRNGSVVSLSHSDDTLSHGYYWVGSVAGRADLWDRQGGYWSTGDESPFDLVARIPDAAPVDNRIESTQTVSPNAATRPTSDEFHAAVMAYMPWIAERIPQHRRVIEAVRLCAKSPEQAACAIEVAWMDGGVEPQPPADDRIQRALQVLRNACDESDDSFDGWDLVRQGIKILEGRE